ncbi:HAD family hydrolase, partial [Streptomyces sp. NPDC002740]
SRRPDSGWRHSPTPSTACRRSRRPTKTLTMPRAVVGDLATVTLSGPRTVELQPYGIDKGTGLALAAEALGVDPAATIAFGDMPNDLPMFRRSGYGVAMANAHPDLRAAADEVTASNGDDGVAVVLERVFG